MVVTGIAAVVVVVVGSKVVMVLMTHSRLRWGVLMMNKWVE